MSLREHKERVETIVDVPREHEMEQIPQEESLLSPELTTPHQSHVHARIETPQNPSSERNQFISRKLVLGTPLGANPQQSTSTGGENVKTIPGKGAPKTPKTGQCGRSCGPVVPSGDGAPSGRGCGPAPTGAHAPVPGVVTRAAAGGCGGGVGAPVVPVPNAQYIY